jgi:signal transduction histidine kinase
MAKILVIEDEAGIRNNLLELLEENDFEVIEAEDGSVGIKLATEQLPDLILCDVMMPQLDGYGVLTALRSNPATQTIPFIFLTAKAGKEALRQGMNLGSDDYLTKPFTAKELLSAIAVRLEKHAVINRQSQERLDELRSNISHALPHELRTPLNGILGLSEILLEEYDTDEPSETREMLKEIHASGQRLFRLIQNFLLYAELELAARSPERIEAYRRSQSFTKEIIVAQAVQQAQKSNREADLQLMCQEISARIAAPKLQKLVEELVDNAFKFSSPGTPITLTSSLDNNMFALTISDEGRGMTAQQIAQVGAYAQFERKLYEQQGSGLGLIIVKYLAELHGGKLTIESIPEQKNTVHVYLPT